MPRFLEKIWQDIRQGHNLEIYLTILVVFMLLILDVFGIADDGAIAAGTLATLALLAFSTLNSREQIQRVEDVTNIIKQRLSDDVVAGDFFWKEKRLLEKDFAQAKFIGVVGYTLTRTLHEYIHTFGSRLAAGATVRFIIADPNDSALLEQLKLRTRIGSVGIASDSFFSEKISVTLEHIRHLANLPSASGTVELGFLPYMASFGMFVIDPDEPHGRIIVELYQHRSTELHPTFELNAQIDSQWYAFFREQFDILWESCGEHRATGHEIDRWYENIGE